MVTMVTVAEQSVINRMYDLARVSGTPYDVGDTIRYRGLTPYDLVLMYSVDYCIHVTGILNGMEALNRCCRSTIRFS